MSDSEYEDFGSGDESLDEIETNVDYGAACMGGILSFVYKISFVYNFSFMGNLAFVYKRCIQAKVVLCPQRKDSAPP